jgi:hypothetical protein
MANWRQAANAMQVLIAPTVLSTVQGLTAGNSARTYIGWPDPNQLNTDLRAATLQTVHASIYAIPGSALTSRYTKEPTVIKADPTETAFVVNNTVLLSGVPLAGDNIFIFVNHHAVQTTVLVGDTMSAITARLVTAINALALPGISASAVAQIITIAGPVYSLTATAVGQGTIYVEVTRVTRRFQLTFWCADDLAREALLLSIVPILANAEFLTYPDSSKGRILFDGELIHDAAMPSAIMRADTFWQVEYPYLLVSSGPRVGDIEPALTCITNPLLQQPSSLNLPFGLTMTTTHDHIHELNSTISGTRPGLVFTLKLLPVPGSEEIFKNGIHLSRVLLNPGINEYTMNGKVIQLGGSVVDSTDVLDFYYEI